MLNAYIYDGLRSPIGRHGGVLASIRPDDLAAEVIKKLIEKTGGILQGMSGSPIIQDGRFVGAVTHMFVEEPKKGAALTVAEMLKKSS